VPDRVREAAGDVDLGDLGAALLAEPPFRALVALGVPFWLAGGLLFLAATRAVQNSPWPRFRSSPSSVPE
jgi:hypothetical protein